MSVAVRLARPVGAIVAVAVICAVLTLAVGVGVAVGAELEDGVTDAAQSFAVDDACLQLARGARSKKLMTSGGRINSCANAMK